MQIHRCFLALDKPDSISVMLCAYTDSYTDNLTILLNHYTHNVKINELFKKGGVLKLRETIQDTLFLSENYKRYYNTFEYMKSDTYNVNDLQTYLSLNISYYNSDPILMWKNNRWNLYDITNLLFVPL